MELPYKALTNFELERYAQGIKNFEGIFMRNTLPKSNHKNGCGIVNLDSKDGNGTHWVCYIKRGNTKVYVDSFGLPPPIKVIRYLG